MNSFTRGLLLAGGLAACLGAQNPTYPNQEANGKDLVATAAAAGQFTTLLAAAKAADLVETLQGNGPLTVFAPTDEAFAKLGKEAIADLLKPENKAKLTAILTYHVVPGRVTAAKVAKLKELTTVQGSAVAIVADQAGVMVGKAKVVQADVMAKNGVIHVIDSVLLPPDNLVATAAKAGKFQTLLTAATAAGLADTLANGGPFTVFAPTDEAFAKLGKATIEDLLKPENKQKLAAILKFHVVAGSVKAAEVKKLAAATTLQGGNLSIKVDGDKVTVNGATVVAVDVVAGNGVIHVIDTVLVPNAQ